VLLDDAPELGLLRSVGGNCHGRQGRPAASPKLIAAVL
jgi:hypothetical protein